MRFDVKGVRADGDVVRLSIDAANRGEVRRALASQGLVILSVRARNPLAAWLGRPRAAFPLDLFCQELVSLLDAGLSLVEAVDLLADKERAGTSGSALRELRADLSQGLRLSDALERQPALFPPLFVATVRAAERTGDIQPAVARFLDYHEQLGRIRRKVVSASVYPLMLLGVGALVTAFMLLYVVPKFSRIYEETGTELPFLTQVLVAWGGALEANAVPVLGGAAAVLVLLAFLATRPPVRRWLGLRLWSVPGIGERLRIYELARFYRTLGMLLTSGITLPTALDMAGGLLAPTLRTGLERAARDVREGRPVSSAFEQHGLTTAVSLRLLAVAERTGRMPELVGRIASFHEDELARWIDWFTRLFEPALMVLIGAMVGLIVVLLYLPIFELAESMG